MKLNKTNSSRAYEIAKKFTAEKDGRVLFTENKVTMPSYITNYVNHKLFESYKKAKTYITTLEETGKGIKYILEEINGHFYMTRKIINDKYNIIEVIVPLNEEDLKVLGNTKNLYKEDLQRLVRKMCEQTRFGI